MVAKAAAVTVGAASGMLVLGQAVDFDQFKEITAFVAFLAIVFTIGWQQVKATREVKPELVAVRGSLDKNTQSQKESAEALKGLCEQMRIANEATLASQNQLTGKIMANDAELYGRVERAIDGLRSTVERALELRPSKGVSRPGRSRRAKASAK